MEKIKNIFHFIKSSAETFVLIFVIVGIFLGITPEKVMLKIFPIISSNMFVYFIKPIGIILIIVGFYIRTRPNKDQKKTSSYIHEQNSTVLLFNFLDQYPFDNKIEDKYLYYASNFYTLGSGATRSKIEDALGDIYNIVGKIVKNDTLKSKLHKILNLFEWVELSKTEKQKIATKHRMVVKLGMYCPVFKNKGEYLKERKGIQKDILYINKKLNNNEVS